MVDEIVGRRLRNRNDLRGSEHPFEVTRPAARTGLLAMTPQGNLRDRGPDQDEEHGDFDVMGIGDGEPPVWLGQEEVERHSR